MGLFHAIMDKIFHHPAAHPAQPQASAAPTAQAAAPAAQAHPAQAQATQAATPAQAQAPVDVEAVLNTMAEAKGGGGNWRSSIVDLLKLLDLDSSLDARKELAGELNVHAGVDGSAEENIALHHAVMQQLAANGGKVPESLKAA